MYLLPHEILSEIFLYLYGADFLSARLVLKNINSDPVTKYFKAEEDLDPMIEYGTISPSKCNNDIRLLVFNPKIYKNTITRTLQGCKYKSVRRIIFANPRMTARLYHCFDDEDKIEACRIIKTCPRASLIHMKLCQNDDIDKEYLPIVESSARTASKLAGMYSYREHRTLEVEPEIFSNDKYFKRYVYNLCIRNKMALFREYHDYIAVDAMRSIYFARACSERFIQGEKEIIRSADAYNLFEYMYYFGIKPPVERRNEFFGICDFCRILYLAVNVNITDWPELDQQIIKHATGDTVKYVNRVINSDRGRHSETKWHMQRKIGAIYNYIKTVKKQRVPEVEPFLFTDKSVRKEYRLLFIWKQELPIKK